MIGGTRRLASVTQLLAQGGWWRGLSSRAAPAELPSLKAALRAVYKKVHPDLFHDCQSARDANTRSFKLLHEYIDAAKTGSKIPLPYRFHFFIRGEGAAGGSSAASSSSSSSGSPAAAAAEAAAAAAAAPAVGLREVSLTLPPPTRGAPGEAMSATTRKAFGSLLEALGLPARFGAGSADEEAAAAEYNRFVSLREFLPAAVETVHQHAAAQVTAQQQLGALRAALRMGRCVTAAFGGPAASAGVVVQLPLLQRLVATLDGLGQGVDLGGLTIMLGGDANGVDALGSIWLAAEGGQPAWASYLSGVDVAYCRERQQLRKAVQAQEAAVAAALGVAMLYTQQETSLSPQYRQALERLAAAATARGPIGGGRFRALPVLLQPAGAAAASSSSNAPGGCTADSDAGLLVAPLEVPPEQLFSAVEQLGGKVVAALQRRQQQEKDLASLRTQVERKVRLRRLLRHPAVTDTQYKSCLDRMLASAQKLTGLLHGQAVRVAEINGLSPDKAVIDVAWNWQL